MEFMLSFFFLFAYPQSEFKCCEYVVKIEMYIESPLRFSSEPAILPGKLIVFFII